MISLFKRHISPGKAFLFLGDTFLLALSLGMAALFYSLFYSHTFKAIISDYPAPYMRGLLVVVFCQIVMYLNDIYNLKVTTLYRELIIRFLASLCVTFILLTLIYAVIPSADPGRGILIIAALIMLPLILSWRYFYKRIIRWARFKERVLVVGTDEVAKRIVRDVLSLPDSGFQVVGFIDENRRALGKSLVNPRILGSFEDISQIALKRKIDRIVVSLPESRGKFPIKSLLDCKMSGIAVNQAHSFYEVLTDKIIVERLNPSWLIFSEGFNFRRITLILKSIGDIVLSCILLLLFLPWGLLLAALIKLDSPGPLIYSQERVGRNGIRFRLYKFRTMGEDAEEDGMPRWASDTDIRITRVGKILRRTRLDELPQLINVLKSEMSFVGPRPERPFFVDMLTREIPYYEHRLAVKPGITGWAQVKYHYGSSKEDAKEKLQYDLYYIKNLSFSLDFSIIFDTINVVLFGKGAV